MVDICFYYGQVPPEVISNNQLNDLIINYGARITSIDGYVDGEVDIYYCEFCDYKGCLYHSFVNLI